MKKQIELIPNKEYILPSKNVIRFIGKVGKSYRFESDSLIITVEEKHIPNMNLHSRN